LEIPVSAPIALTRSSTSRTDVPVTYASITTANSAWSIRRRRSSRDGKNDPARSLGMARSTSPAVVVSTRSRWPLRWAVRASVRSCGAAPITAVASASINACRITCSAERMTSVESEALSASRTSTRADWDRAIVWFSFTSSLAGSCEASHDGPLHTLRTRPAVTPLDGTSPCLRENLQVRAIAGRSWRASSGDTSTSDEHGSPDLLTVA
jgi:hypothetical protein